VLWRDVAEQYQFEGFLDMERCVLLAHVPSKFTTSKKAYFYSDFLAIGDTSSILFKGRLPDVGKLNYRRGPNSTPTYWWPEDRSWCIYTDLDLTYRLIGANEAAIRALEHDAEIEGFQIEANLNFIRRKIANMPRR
jgi:hypothetical protein